MCIFAAVFNTVHLVLQELDRRRFLLRYVQGIQPEVMEDFVRHAPPHVNAFPVALLVFVCVVAPEPVAMLIRQGSVQKCSLLQVVDAMRQTIKNYTGGLPHEFFEVSISAKGEDLAQLMYTMMMSGFMFRNAQYRLELRDSMLPAGMSLRQCMTY